MVEEMIYLNISGPKDDIDRIVTNYLSKYEIHLENAYAKLSSEEDVIPFLEPNPYKNLISQADALKKYLPKESTPSEREMSVEEAIRIIQNSYSKMEEYTNQHKRSLLEEKRILTEQINQLEPFHMINYNLDVIHNFTFLKFRFGKISHQYYNKFLLYVYDDLNIVFCECNRDAEYVWGIYFVVSSLADKVDAIFASLHFEKINLQKEFDGTPEEAFQKLLIRMRTVRKQLKKHKQTLMEQLADSSGDILLAEEILNKRLETFDIRKYAACTHGSDISFYILCGWMGEKDTKNFLKEIENDSNIYCTTQTVKNVKDAEPPTKLRNPKIFKPFEMFVTMYGLPAYNEMDPTIFIALTYTFIFGIMFGDIGQGLCLAIGGFALYKIKHMDLGAIVGVAGCWSTFFGFMYGSLFGFEEVLHAVWRKPMEDIMTTLTTAIIFGVALILFAMVLNIINAVKIKNFEKAVLDPSGIAGLLVYGTVVTCVLFMMKGAKLPPTILLVILVGIPLLAIFLKEPLNNLVLKKKHIFPKGSKAMFFVEAFVELFDVVLSYATNTISFVRVGAFALSHAGMMGVVLSLAGAESGNPNLLVLILGNILVTGLEGLVVGIQVLRLEYYEMFSRFYSGSGKEFQAFKTHN